MCQQEKMQQWMRGLLLAVFAVLSVISLSACTSPTKPASVQKTRGATSLNSESKYSNMLSDFGRFRALLIGNQNYKHLDRLETPIADVTEIAKVLKEEYGFEIEGPLLDANKQQIMDAIAKISNTMNRDNDSVLIYYAGHGAVASNDVGYWQPIDAKEGAIDRYDFVNWISSQEITNILKAMQAKHVVVVADSCYSGRILRDRGAGSAEKQIPDVGWIEWLNAMQQMHSRTALTAGGDEPVVDSGGSGHSVFAKAFLDVLRGSREILDGNTLFDRLKKKVVANRSITQKPHYNYIDNAVVKDGDNEGDFLFVHKDHPPIKEIKKPEIMPINYVGLWKGGIQPPPHLPPRIQIVHNEATFELAQRIENALHTSGLETNLRVYDDWSTSIRSKFAQLKELVPDDGGYNIFFSDTQRSAADKVQRIAETVLEQEETVPEKKHLKSTIEAERIIEALDSRSDELLIVLNNT